MTRKVPKDILDMLAEAHEESQLSDAPDEKSETSKSGKSEKSKSPMIYLPVLTYKEFDDYNDAFTQKLLKVLRRKMIVDGDTTVVLAYVKSIEDIDAPWLKLAWYKTQKNELVLDDLYKKATAALESRIREILWPIFDELCEKLKKHKTLNDAQLQEMIKGKLPICYLKKHFFHVQRNGNQYVIPGAWINEFTAYAITLLLEPKSPIANIQYITNDESQKDSALHYYDLNPSNRYTDKAPKLYEYSPAWFNFLQGRFNNPNMDLLRLTHFIYGLMSAEYHSRQSLALFCKGGSGKSTFKEAIATILPRVLQTKLKLKDLCGEFAPPQLDGCRGLALDEGAELQKFFDGDLFKEITGASDDDAFRYVDRKFKDPLPIRTGSIRFMFLTNSRLCIRDDAGLTRISPIFFRNNHGINRDGKELIAELAAEGKEFIEFCIDNENYYRNVTSKFQHRYCPLIENNGTINILTDKQFDDWYNETSDELYFSEDDLQCPEMRERLYEINMENCSQATTDPVTGDVYVYGSRSSEIVVSTMQDLMSEIFAEDADNELSTTELSNYILDQLKDSKKEYNAKFKEIGFKYTNDTTANNLSKTQAWKKFKFNILNHFPNASDERRKDKRYIKGIRLKKKARHKSSSLNIDDKFAE